MNILYSWQMPKLFPQSALPTIRGLLETQPGQEARVAARGTMLSDPAGATAIDAYLQHTPVEALQTPLSRRLVKLMGY